MNSNIIEVFIKNEIDYIVQIFKKFRLNMLCEIDYKNVFFVKFIISSILSSSSNKSLLKFFANIN